MALPALRRHARTARYRACVALAVAVFLRAARAQPAVLVAEEPIRVEDRSEATCSDAARFYAGMAARTARTRLARPDEPARVFVVLVVRRGEAVVGRLTIRDPSGRETHRDIRGHDCAEVVSGLSLVAALAVDPAARPERTPPGEGAASAGAPVASPPATPPVSAAPAPSSGGPAAQLAPTPVRTVTPPPSPRALTDDGASDVGGARPHWSVGLAARAAAFGGVAPAPLVGGSASVDARYDKNGGLFAPRLSLSFEHGEHAAFAVGAAAAQFIYSAGALDLCPVRVVPVGALTVHACARVAIGVLTTSGASPESAAERTVRRGWADVGARAHIDWPLSRSWAVELQGGCMFPLRRDTFGFGADAFHEVPRVGGLAALGIHLRLP